ncbi:MAG: PIG-L family deacetylase [Candidatus Magasanikbacteria bacterium]|nr:PIG-L family deacetylase [Candidatus Magasanikbacteria bacterium]
MKSKILVVAAHPDDELLGVGGTVAYHSGKGDSVYALILGQGALSRSGAKPAAVTKLHEQAKQASKIIGFREVFFADFPDNAFDSVSLLTITQEVEKYLTKIAPDRVYTHHEYDLNIDHRLTFQAVLTACRPCNQYCPRELYTFETLSSTEWQSKDHKQFQPTVYQDITATIGTKLKALACYAGEMRSYPHPRSLEGAKILAQCRGLEVQLKYAEAFHLIRKIQ